MSTIGRGVDLDGDYVVRGCRNHATDETNEWGFPVTVKEVKTWKCSDRSSAVEMANRMAAMQFSCTVIDMNKVAAVYSTS